MKFIKDLKEMNKEDITIAARRATKVLRDGDLVETDTEEEEEGG